MKQKLKAIFKGSVVFYPLLFAAFPILFLYTHNISETPASQMWLPLVISVASALVLWAVLSLILRSLAKAGLATAIFLALFFSYGRLYDVLGYLGVVPRHAYLLLGMLFIWGYCVYFIGRAKRDFRITTRFFNITAVVLIAINLFNIASYEIKLARLNTETSVESPEYTTTNSTDLSTLPDIYYIIFDEYAHPDTMKEYYDYDNSGFIKSLEDKGFFVANQSKTRTPHTVESISQTLNMEYLTAGWYWYEEANNWKALTDPEGIYPDYSAWSEPAYQKLACSEVADFLRAEGYKYVYFGNWASSNIWGKYMKNNVDLYFNYYETASTPKMSAFQDILWNTTMLKPFYLHFVGVQCGMSYRYCTMSTLEHLKEMPSLEGPKFVYAHFMCPHEVFVFGPNGEGIAPVNWSNYKDKQFYLGQYIFISAEIEKMVDGILKNSANEPIIVIQSDHGLRPVHQGIDIGGDEWRKILNAYYLPGDGKELLYDSISPVNSFRVIFNYYFGADYPLLEDNQEQ